MAAATLQGAARAVAAALARDEHGVPDPWEAAQGGGASRDYASAADARAPPLRVAEVHGVPDALLGEVEAARASGGDGRVFMGLLPALRRAWLAVGARLYVWAYAGSRDLVRVDCSVVGDVDGRADAPLAGPIVDVHAARAKCGVFVSGVRHVLALVAPGEIILLAASLDDNGGLSLKRTGLRFATDDAVALCVASSACGRVFAGCDDGALYELCYGREKSLFSSGTRVVASAKDCSAGAVWRAILPSPIRRAASLVIGQAGAAAIVGADVDSARGVLVLLRADSAVEAYRLGAGGAPALLGAVRRPAADAARLAGAAQAAAGLRDARLVSVAAPGPGDSAYVHAVATTATGARILFSALPRDARALARAQVLAASGGALACLEVVHVRLPPDAGWASASGTGGTGAGAKRVLQTWAPAVHAALVRPGVFLAAHSLGGDEDALCAATANPALLSDPAAPPETAVSSDVLRIDGKVWAMAEEADCGDEATSASTSDATASQSDTPNAHSDAFADAVAVVKGAPRRIVVLTHTGVHVLAPAGPREALRDALRAARGSAEQSRGVARVFSLREHAVVLALALCCDPDDRSECSLPARDERRALSAAALSAAVRYAGRPGVAASSLHAARGASLGASLLALGAPPEFEHSALLLGLHLYVARCLAPVWHAALGRAPVPPPRVLAALARLADVLRSHAALLSRARLDSTATAAAVPPGETGVAPPLASVSQHPSFANTGAGSSQHPLGVNTGAATQHPSMVNTGAAGHYPSTAIPGIASHYPSSITPGTVGQYPSSAITGIASQHPLTVGTVAQHPSSVTPGTVNRYPSTATPGFATPYPSTPAVGLGQHASTPGAGLGMYASTPGVAARYPSTPAAVAGASQQTLAGAGQADRRANTVPPPADSFPDEALQDALRAETAAIEGLRALVEAALQLSAFVAICRDYRLLPPGGDALAAAAGRTVFADALCTPQGRAAVASLGSALVQRQLALRAPVEPLAAVLVQRCGLFFSAADVLLFRGAEGVALALSAAAHGEAGEAARLCAESRAQLLAAVRAFRASGCALPVAAVLRAAGHYARLAHVPGAVELLLSTARLLDPEAPDAASLRAAALDLVRVVHGGDSESGAIGGAAAQPNAETADQSQTAWAGSQDQGHADRWTLAPGVPPPEPESLRRESLAAALRFGDGAARAQLYVWLLSAGLSDALLDADAPDVAPFLEKLAAAPVRDSAAAVGHRDLLWRLYVRRERHADAARVLEALAGADDVRLPLAGRIERLSRAVVHARAAGDAADAQRLEDRVDVARIQQRVVAEARTDLGPVADVALLEEGALLSISALFNEYARPLGLHVSALCIVHTSSHADAPLVHALWDALLARAIATSSQPAAAFAAAGQRIAHVAAAVPPSSPAFPLAFVVDWLLQRALALAGSALAPSLVFEALSAGVSPADAAAAARLVAHSSAFWRRDENRPVVDALVALLGPAAI